MTKLEECQVQRLKDMTKKADENIDIVEVEIFTNYCKVIYFEKQGKSNIQKELRCPLHTSFEDVIAEIIDKKNDKKVKSDNSSNLDLLKELLANPRVEGITINIEKVGSVEETKINAKLKEIPQALILDDSKLSEVDKQGFLQEINKKASKIAKESLINL